MRVSPCLLIIALVLAPPAISQPTGPSDSTECEAEKAAIDRDIELARSKGQMVRRQQLAATLAALQARCDTLNPEQTRAASIEKLEHEIQELRKALNHAEEQLRGLKRGGS